MCRLARIAVVVKCDSRMAADPNTCWPLQDQPAFKSPSSYWSSSGELSSRWEDGLLINVAIRVESQTDDGPTKHAFENHVGQSFRVRHQLRRVAELVLAGLNAGLHLYLSFQVSHCWGGPMRKRKSRVLGTKFKARRETRRRRRGTT
jgi:hypothetical protein